MSRLRLALAVAVGLAVASLPFWHYTAPPVDLIAHDDHEPWYGGQLGMAGDHHVELVQSERGTEVYVSDRSRRPVYPASASVAVDGGQPIELRAEGEYLTSDARLEGREATVTAVLPDGARLAVTFQLTGN